MYRSCGLARETTEQTNVLATLEVRAGEQAKPHALGVSDKNLGHVCVERDHTEGPFRYSSWLAAYD